MIKMNGKSDKYYKHRNDYHSAGSGGGKRIVPELDPTENSHLY